MEQLIKAYITFLGIWSQSQNWSYALAHANFAILYKFFSLKPFKRLFESTGRKPVFLGGFPGEAMYRLEA